MRLVATNEEGGEKKKGENVLPFERWRINVETIMDRLSEMNDEIISRIYIIRGRKVMLNSDLARIYGVTTARLNQQVRRNMERFPVDFMFELTIAEY